MPRLPSQFIIVGSCSRVNAGESAPAIARQGDRGQSRYNLAMRFTTAAAPKLSPLMFALLLELAFVTTSTPACTFFKEAPPRAFSEATGGEGLERVFWKEVAAANWVEVERALASNYTGVTAGGMLDRAVTMEQYRQWKVKDFAIGDLKTELNGTTIVVTYTITLNGTMLNGTAGNGGAGPQPLPSEPQHMMTVWQQQKSGWVVIAHSVSRP